MMFSWGHESNGKWADVGCDSKVVLERKMIPLCERTGNVYCVKIFEMLVAFIIDNGKKSILLSPLSTFKYSIQLSLGMSDECNF